MTDERAKTAPGTSRGVELYTAATATRGLGSAAVSASLTLHRAIRTFDRPQLFLAVSEFVRRKHLDAGWDADQIRVKANFAWSCPRRSGPGESFVFVGRLSPEKGLAHLLRAWHGVERPLIVIGDGPESTRCTGSLLHKSSSPARSLETRSTRYCGSPRALIVPSICFEGQPRTILEAYAAGVPVIARIGGLPEVVGHDEGGYLVDPDDDGRVAHRDPSARRR